MMTTKLLTRMAKDSQGNTHEVYAHWILTNNWEFYQLEPADEFGVVFGYMTNCDYPELGSQHESELDDNKASYCKGFTLWDIAPPIGWEWLETDNE